jgi:hypothetical protein
MGKTFKVGDHVSWNSEAGRVRGKIVKVHRRDVNYKGYVHHATPDEPQYEIKSDKTDHVALHKGAVLRRLAKLDIANPEPLPIGPATVIGDNVGFIRAT